MVDRQKNVRSHKDYTVAVVCAMSRDKRRTLHARPRTSAATEPAGRYEHLCPRHAQRTQRSACMPPRKPRQRLCGYRGHELGANVPFHPVTIPRGDRTRGLNSKAWHLLGRCGCEHAWQVIRRGGPIRLGEGRYRRLHPERVLVAATASRKKRCRDDAIRSPS